MAEHDELESYWEDIAAAKRSPILVITGRVGDAKGALELASAMTSTIMQRRYPGGGNFIEETIKTFVEQWRMDLLTRGPGGIVELVLEDAKLTIDELKAFIRALPATLVQRIIDNGAASASAKGIHALMSIEHLWRTQRSAFRRDYLLGRHEDGTLMVTVYPARPPAEAQGTGPATEVVFRLDDTFDLNNVPT